MPHGPWLTPPHRLGMTVQVTDYVDENSYAFQNAGRSDDNSEDPGNFAAFNHDPALSFTKAAHGTDPLLFDHSSLGFADVASAWGMREAWAGAIAQWTATASRLGVTWFPIENRVYRYDPPVWPAGAIDIEYEYAPGTGIADDGGAHRLYLASGVTNVRISADGFAANPGGEGPPLHGFDANLEVRLAPGNPKPWTSSHSGELISLADFTVPATQLTPEELTASPLLASIPIAALGDSVYDPDSGFWIAVDANTPLDLAFVLPDSALPRADRLDFQPQAVEVYLAVDHHRSDTAPPVGSMAQTPTYPHGLDNQEFDFPEYWTASVQMTGALTDSRDLQIRAIYHLTFDFQPARYRFVFETPPIPPPQRQFPRDDGLGISTHRSWPPATSKQFGLRRGATGTYQ